MTDFWKSYETDKKLEEEGVWIEGFHGGAAIKCRRLSSKAAKAARTHAEAKHRAAIQRAQRTRTELDDDIAREINLDWFINGVVVDWKGVCEKDGTPLKFNAKNGLMVFKALPDFLDDVILACTDRDIFRNEEAEDDAKNSPKSPDGKPSGATS